MRAYTWGHTHIRAFKQKLIYTSRHIQSRTYTHEGIYTCRHLSICSYTLEDIYRAGHIHMKASTQKLIYTIAAVLNLWSPPVVHGILPSGPWANTIFLFFNDINTQSDQVWQFSKAQSSWVVRDGETKFLSGPESQKVENRCTRGHIQSREYTHEGIYTWGHLRISSYTPEGTCIAGHVKKQAKHRMAYVDTLGSEQWPQRRPSLAGFQRTGRFRLCPVTKQRTGNNWLVSLVHQIHS